VREHPQLSATQASAVSHVRSCVNTSGTSTMITMFGPSGHSQAALRQAAQDVECDGHRVVWIDLEDSVTEVDVVNEISRQFGHHKSWLVFPQAMQVQRELALDWPESHPAPTRLPMGLIRPWKARWIRRRLRSVPKHSSGQSRRAERLNKLQDLAPAALAHDLHGRAAWKRDRHLCFFVSGHERYAKTIASRRRDDFLWALAQALQRLGTPITIVVARETFFNPPGFVATWYDHGAPQSALLRQHGLGDVVDDDDGPSIDDGDRTLLALASAPRSFDLELLNVIAPDQVAPAAVEAEVKRGTIEPCPNTSSGEARWRVVPKLRAEIFSDLAAPPFDAEFKAAHKRLANHYAAGDAPQNEDDRFLRELERLYHETTVDPDGGLDLLFAVADDALAEFRVDRCQRIVDALDGLHGLDGEAEIRSLLLRVRLYADLQGFDAAQELLEAAAAERPSIDQRFDDRIAAIELHIAKLDRLRGNYDAAIDRYEHIRALALEAPPNRAVVAHASWQLAIIHGRMHSLPAAMECIESAERGYKLLLEDGEVAATRETRGLGIQAVGLKQGHIDRHFADLYRLTGKMSLAKDRITKAMAAYYGRDERARAYAKLTWSHILRMDYDADTAVKLAESVLQLYEEGKIADKRLRGHALRALVLARLANGEAPYDLARTLAEVKPDVYPSGPPSGLLVLAEIERHRGHWAEAAGLYEEASEAAVRAQSSGDRCAALIGLLECRRCGPPNIGPVSEKLWLLEQLLTEPCLEQIPSLAVQAQLERAYLRPEQRAEAIEQAFAASDRIKLTSGRTPHRELVTWFAEGLAGDSADDLSTLCLELP
jgi:tetratricopeptide (TPR) repeat protein